MPQPKYMIKPDLKPHLIQLQKSETAEGCCIAYSPQDRGAGIVQHGDKQSGQNDADIAV